MCGGEKGLRGVTKWGWEVGVCGGGGGGGWRQVRVELAGVVGV